MPGSHNTPVEPRQQARRDAVQQAILEQLEVIAKTLGEILKELKAKK